MGAVQIASGLPYSYPSTNPHSPFGCVNIASWAAGFKALPWHKEIVPAFSSSMQYPPERQERTSRRDPSKHTFPIMRRVCDRVMSFISFFHQPFSSMGTAMGHWKLPPMGMNDTYQCPAQRFMPVRACPSANAFRRNREVHHKPTSISPPVIARETFPVRPRNVRETSSLTTGAGSVSKPEHFPVHRGTGSV